VHVWNPSKVEWIGIAGPSDISETGRYITINTSSSPGIKGPPYWDQDFYKFDRKTSTADFTLTEHPADNSSNTVRTWHADCQATSDPGGMNTPKGKTAPPEGKAKPPEGKAE